MLKQALTSSPILWNHNFDRPFLVQTEVEVDGKEHPIVYASRKLSPAEQQFTAVEREALTIKWVVEELQYSSLAGRRCSRWPMLKTLTAASPGGSWPSRTSLF